MALYPFFLSLLFFSLLLTVSIPTNGSALVLLVIETLVESVRVPDKQFRVFSLFTLIDLKNLKLKS